MKEGDSWSFNAFVADITERKRGEEQLRHQLAFTTAITAHLGDLLRINHDALADDHRPA